MAHGYHEGLPGYHPDQLLVDGCAECEQRSREQGSGIGYLDPHRFARAWIRAASWGAGEIAHVSQAEVPMLSALWAVQLQLHTRGVRIGSIPRGDTTFIT